MTKGKIIFTGNFWEYFGISLLLAVLTIITLGIAGIYWVYWSVKYFFSRLEIEMYTGQTTVIHTQQPESG